MRKSPPISFELTVLGLFALSGFAGLVYESIWTQYLKLILGHAAYAQSLVLSIFMGGMALGAWLTSRYSVRMGNLMIAYAMVEVLIGLAALGFHSGFLKVEEQLLLHWLPAAGSPAMATGLKWGLSSLLILPQTILLGATFPMMSGALVRLYPGRSGSSLSMLYFANSIGAAIGVLCSGFVLLPALGLPGTVHVAGIISIAVGAGAWLLGRGLRELGSAPVRQDSGKLGPVTWILTAAALVTGMASFIYEIGWVRMLSLVLGTSNQSFELMLSAFIGGLALGSLWIRTRMQRVVRPVVWAANVQLLMGALALLSIPLYLLTFELMSSLLDVVPRDAQGLAVFRIGSHGLALLLMLPPTFMAGMTLPLITFALIKAGGGEASIGRIYAANTLGAILGVALAVHWAMPLLGLKGVIMLGAGLDIALGAVLLLMVREHAGRRWLIPATMAAAFGLVAVSVDFDLRRLASGIYRSGMAQLPDDFDVVYHKDGPTASIDLIAGRESGLLMLATNGKVDASVRARGPYPSSDEYTQALVSLIPLGLRPDAQSAAMIGLGSGMSTHVLLGSRALQEVVSIEIEPSVVEAARAFGPFVERAFNDHRSLIVVEDAKTWFSARQQRFDIIVSEPSNPWVSGIAALFTREYYAQIRRHLNEGGVFVQWLHLYEINAQLVASVLKALGQEFEDYAIFQMVEGTDVALVASNSPLGDQFKPQIFQEAALLPLFERLALGAANDLTVRYLGDRQLFEPYIETLPVAVNSDFYPVLTLNAPRALFLRQNAQEFMQPSQHPVPVVDMLSDRFRVKRPFPVPQGRVSSNYVYQRREALVISALLGGQSAPGADPALVDEVQNWRSKLTDCDSGTGPGADFINSALDMAQRTSLYLSADESAALWANVRATDCVSGADTVRDVWISLHLAAGQRDADALVLHAEALLSRYETPADRSLSDYLLIAAMTGRLSRGEVDEARAVWNRWGDVPEYTGDRAILAILHALAFADQSRDSEN
jgi:predicted membrane-bound spermidine synthase